jgi:transglutaminase-like putative cysteine protease
VAGGNSVDQEGTTPRDIAPGASFAPAPDWVDLQPYTIPATPNPYFISGGLCALFDESQIDLCRPGRAWFYRRADMITAVAGAERAAQFSVTFDPQYESVEIHSVQVKRGDQVFEHAGNAGFEAFRREQNMERLIFDGRQTIAYTIPDVRPGDVVETSYTRYGVRKSLNGRHAVWIPMEWNVGIVEVRVRQRTPKSRVIHERGYNHAPQATETVTGDIVDRRWRTYERPSFKYEAMTPPWTLQSASIQWSEWKDWAEVAANFTPLYDDTEPLADDLEAEIARIAAAEPTAAGRAGALLRFIQNAIRYLAISIGEGGFTPRKISDIWKMRYGDCKDKSKLFTIMGRKLGLDICPALVNTHDGVALREYLPSGQLFDHCIVRLRLDGKTHWLDGTRETQDAPLGLLGESHFGWALPLEPGANDLERMADEPHVLTQHIEEAVALSEPPGAADYDWRVTQSGWRAEDLRGRIAREGAVGLFKLYSDDITRTLPGARALAQEMVKDDIADNTIAIHEKYEITDAWQKRPDGRLGFSTQDLYVRAVLGRIDPGPRKHDIYLGHVGKTTRSVVIETYKPWEITPFDRKFECSAIRYETAFKQLGPSRCELTQMLDITSWVLPAAEAQKYRDIVNDMEKTDISFTTSLATAAKADRPAQKNRYYLWILVAAGALAAIAAYAAAFGGWR